MIGDRANKQKATVYHEGLYEIRCGSDGIWYIVDGSFQMEEDFKTLNTARQWCKDHPADEEFEGKWL